MTERFVVKRCECRSHEHDDDGCTHAVDVNLSVVVVYPIICDECRDHRYIGSGE